jgi:hypothetical protein
MKPTIFLLFAILPMTKVVSQKLGFKVGLQYPDLYAFDGNVHANYRPGFQAGVLAEFPLSKHFGFDIGLGLNQKGYNKGINGVPHFLKPIYLHLPVRITYNHYPHTLSFGAFLSCGIGGNVEYKKIISRNLLYSNSIRIPRNVAFGSGADDDFSRWDGGICAEAGVHFSPALRLNVFGELGLVNAVTRPDYFPETTNVYTVLWGLGITWFFHTF